MILAAGRAVAAQPLSPWFLSTAAGAVLILGGLHALESRLRKAIGDYRANASHTLLLSFYIATSRAIALVLLGAISLSASRFLIPKQMYPLPGLLCGLMIAALGGLMLLRELAGAAARHDHIAPGAHLHWLSRDARGGKPSTADTKGQVVSLPPWFRSSLAEDLLAYPAVLVVLLSVSDFRRAGFGFLLIVAFSLGFGVVLLATGTRTVDEPPLSPRRADPREWPRVVAASLVLVLGCLVAYQGFSAANLHLDLRLRDLAQGRLGPLLYVIGLGLILGMRHSTDADHVVAISTIVSKQRSIRGAAFIGSVWGIGHTITIFIVGSLIILFGVEIPPRLGLSMEFCVALMLVLLGVLNLTGVLAKVTGRCTPKQFPITAAADQPRRSTFSGRVLHQTIGRFGAFQFLRPLVIGLVHGLAGSAAVALLVLSTIHNPVWATFYLLVFGAGTMVGMMCMTAAMAVPFTYAGEHFAKMSRYLNYASGLASLCFGSFLVYQLGYVGNLFGSHPIWTPQ